LAALAPSLPLELAAMAFVGWGSISFMSMGNSTLQLTAAPEMRGRVMSLWFVAFQGSTPIGGPIVGWLMSVAGPRSGLGVASVTCLVVALGGLAALYRRRSDLDHHRQHHRPAPQPVVDERRQVVV
ncbi:MAG: MFS transporter, partial [Solirubrobacterales bacterium]|nr:MFS transporter [Solirubrobacterales bacterium]